MRVYQNLWLHSTYIPSQEKSLSWPTHFCGNQELQDLSLVINVVSCWKEFDICLIKNSSIFCWVFQNTDQMLNQQNFQKASFNDGSQN